MPKKQGNNFVRFENFDKTVLVPKFDSQKLHESIKLVHDQFREAVLPAMAAIEKLKEVKSVMISGQVIPLRFCQEGIGKFKAVSPEAGVQLELDLMVVEPGCSWEQLCLPLEDTNSSLNIAYVPLS